MTLTNTDRETWRREAQSAVGLGYRDFDELLHRRILALLDDLTAKDEALKDILWTAMVGENTGSSALKACGKIRLIADASLAALAPGQPETGDTP